MKKYYTLLTLDVGLIIGGFLMGIAYSVQQNGTSVKIGMFEVVK